MLALSHRCQTAFSPLARTRGDEYFRAGRVALYVAEGHLLTASVRGNSLRRYTVMLDWKGVGEDQSVQVFCSCPYYRGGEFCKHLWAVLRKADDAGHSVLVPGEGPLRLTVDDDVLAAGEESTEEVEEDAVLASATESTPAEGEGGRGGWQWQIRSILRRRDPEEKTSATLASRTLYYVLNPESSRQRNALVVDFWHRQTAGPNADGSRFRPAKLGPNDVRQHGPEDRELLAVLLGLQQLASPTHVPAARQQWPRAIVTAEARDLLLPKLVATGRFGILASQTATALEPLVLDNTDPFRLELALRAADGGDWAVEGAFVRGDTRIPAREPQLAIADGTLLLGAHADGTPARIARWGEADHFHWVFALREERDIRIPQSEAAQAVETLLTAPNMPMIRLPLELKWDEQVLAPVPFVQLRHPLPSAKAFLMTVAFDYEGNRVSSAGGASRFLDAPRRRIGLRDRAAETARLEELFATGAIETPPRGSGLFSMDREFFSEMTRRLLDSGWQVEAEGRKMRRPTGLQFAIRSKSDWFELSGAADFDGLSVPLPKLLAALRAADRFVPLGDGTVGMLPEAWLEKYAPLATLGAKGKDGLRFRRVQGPWVDAMLAGDANVDADEATLAAREQFQKLEQPSPVEPTKNFHGELRRYQKEGLGWLKRLEELDYGGILADDMGLGKTVQCLAFLLARRERGSHRENGVALPSLAVVPKSIVFNWIEEATRFAPELRVLNYTGSARGERAAALPQQDLIVTTYQTLRRDIETLRQLRFDCVILDEAQSIKNEKALTAKACRQLHGRFRLAMTGTPIENSARDLFSLLEFVNPGLVGPGFRRQVCDQEVADPRQLEALGRALRPFLLRRTKENVLSELPTKTEQTLRCELGDDERKAYDELKEYYRVRLAEAIERGGIEKSKLHVLEALLRLRQAACHPGLLDKARGKESSAKLETLLLHLQPIVREGHKALVFSQFTTFLDLARGHLEAAGLGFTQLDGRTRDRRAVIEKFQNDPACPILLVSLKAGGLGLNLTAADYVFLLDPWWNPAAEAQAIDRAHRLGQSRKVFAYRLIAPGTVEEKIASLQSTKREVAAQLVGTGAGSWLQKLTTDDLKFLLS